MSGKGALSERDICTQCITPALTAAGWDLATQVREEVTFTKGRIIVRGRLVTRGKPKRADYVLYYRPNIPIAVIAAREGTAARAERERRSEILAEVRDWSATACRV